MPRTYLDRYIRGQTLAKGILLAFSLGFCIFTNQARADSLHPAMTDKAHELARIERELDSKRARVEMLVCREKEAFEEFLDIEEKLELTRRLIGGLASRETAAERKLLSEAKSLEEIRSELHSRREESRRRLRAIYKHRRTIPQNMVWAGASPADLTGRIKFTRRILEADQNSVKAAEGRKVYLEENSQKLGKSVAELSLLGSVKTDEQGACQGELRERERLLGSIRSEKNLCLQAIRELEKRAEKIRRALGGFQEEGTHSPAEEPEEGGWFESLRGRLPWPVEGKVVSTFGEDRHPLFRTITERSGIEIEARAGTGIAAVAEGRVIYLSRLRGYGNLLILDHGDDYYTLYAHVAEISVWPGAKVGRLQNIGVVGEGETDSTPGLHFEIRKGKQPLDPLEWLK